MERLARLAAAVVVSASSAWLVVPAASRAAINLPYSYEGIYKKDRAYADGRDSIVIDMYVVGERCNQADSSGAYPLTNGGPDCPGGNTATWHEEGQAGIGFSMGSGNPNVTFNHSWYVSGTDGHVQVLVHSKIPGNPLLKLYLDQAHTEWYADMGPSDTYFDAVPTFQPCPDGQGNCTPPLSYAEYIDPATTSSSPSQNIKLITPAGTKAATKTTTRSPSPSAATTPKPTLSPVGLVKGATTVAPTPHATATERPLRLVAATVTAAVPTSVLVAGLIISLIGLGYAGWRRFRPTRLE